MKTIYFLLVFLLGLNYQAISQSESISGFADIPKGQVFMSHRNFNIEAFSISKTEISNKQYKLFLEWLKDHDKKEEMMVAKPTLSKEDEKLLPKKYLKSKKYDEYPVVGITKKQAEMYCDYLKEINPNHKGAFRLPSEREWVYAARAGNDLYRYSTGMTLKDLKDNYICNYKVKGKKNAPLQAISYNPNSFGLYNMCGNVAEWLNADGRTKGGSWNDEPEYIEVVGRDAYMGKASASPFIGFRPLWAVDPKN